MKEKNKIESRYINYGKRGSILTSSFDLTLNLSLFFYLPPLSSSIIFKTKYVRKTQIKNEARIINWQWTTL